MADLSKECVSTKWDKIHDLYVEIDRKKNQLSETDYQVIKMVECSLLGKECDYNITEVHADRQTLRDQINQLEAELADLEKE